MEIWMKLIIFDVYGTLISTGTGSLDAVKKFCHYKTKILIWKNFIKIGKNNIASI